MRWAETTRHATSNMRRRQWHDLQPWTEKGSYVNMLNVDVIHRVVEAYGVEPYAGGPHQSALRPDEPVPLDCPNTPPRPPLLN